MLNLKKATRVVIPLQTVFMGRWGVLFLRCPCISYVRPSITFGFLSILKSHRWNFIKHCEHTEIDKLNYFSKNVRAKDNSFRVIFLCNFKWLFSIYGLCLYYDSAYKGQSTPATAFDGAV